MKSALFHCSIRQLKRTDTGTGGKPVSALAACHYIKRKGAYTAKNLAKARRKSEKEERLVLAGTFSMPSWARGENKDEVFWKAADEYERANGRLALKIECAIPRDIPPNKWEALTREFCTRQFKGHPVSFAIHEGRASDGKTNPHIHFEASERALDGIERPPEQFFRRANPKNPAKGGAAKDRRWHHKDFFHQVRMGWAEVCNEFMAAAGADARVDHRSNADRGIEQLPGIHDGPHRRAMLARGVRLGPHPAWRRRRALHAEERAIDSQLNSINFFQGMISMPTKHGPTNQKSPTKQALARQMALQQEERENQALLRRGKIRIVNALPRGPVNVSSPLHEPGSEQLKQKIQSFLTEQQFTVEWLPHLSTSPNQLPPFKAWDGEGHEVGGYGDTFVAFDTSDKTLAMVADLAVMSGFKSVYLNSGDEATKKRLAVLCHQRGLKIKNAELSSLPEFQGAGDPLPPQGPMTTKPAPKKRKAKEFEAREVSRQFFVDQMPPRVAGSPGGENMVTDAHPFVLARNAAEKGWDKFHLYPRSVDNRRTQDGFDAFAFYMLTEQGVKPSQIFNDDPLFANKDGTLKCSAKLAQALDVYYERVEETAPSEVRRFIDQAPKRPQPPASKLQPAPTHQRDPQTPKNEEVIDLDSEPN
jgi:hypothetical protein